MPSHAERDDLFDDGNANLAIGEIPAAIENYRQCVAVDPEFFDGWHALGMALLKNGDIKEAIGAALKATTLKPNDLLAWTSLSQMYVQNKQIAEAEDAKGKARILSLGGKIVREESERS